MEGQSQQTCAICHQQPENMLIVTCGHNLCLDCATQLFSASTQQNQLQCQICMAITPLDQESIDCLASLACASINQHSQNEHYFNTHGYHQHSKVPPLPSKNQQKHLICQQHQQKSLYYCFDCHDPHICSQCILHNEHQGHRVYTLKKAANIIIQQLNKDSHHLNDTRRVLVGQTQRANQQQRQCERSFNQLKNNLRGQFDAIIGQVTAKFNELNSQLDAVHRRNMEVIAGRLNTIIARQEQINQIMEMQNQMQQLRPEEAVSAFGQIQANKQKSEAEMPFQFNHHIKCVQLHQQQSVLLAIQNIMRGISWHSDYPLKQNQWQYNLEQRGKLGQSNKFGQSFNCAQPSLLLHSRAKAASMRNQDKNNKSLGYSGIKDSSRRLQLSRSMHNATNIINKLSQRIKR